MNFSLRTTTLAVIALIFSSFSAFAQCEITNFNKVPAPTSATVSWSAISDIIQYEYFVSLTPPNPQQTPGTYTTSNAVSLQGLDPNHTYYFCVRAICSSGTSAWVCESFATPDPSSVNTVTKQPEFTITAYPNPTTDKLNIVLPEQYNGRGNIIVTSLLGSVVAQTNTFGRYAHVNLSGMAPGLYLVKYTDGVNTKTIKVNKL